MANSYLFFDCYHAVDKLSLEDYVCATGEPTYNVYLQMFTYGSPMEIQRIVHLLYEANVCESCPVKGNVIGLTE